MQTSNFVNKLQEAKQRNNSQILNKSLQRTEFDVNELHTSPDITQNAPTSFDSPVIGTDPMFPKIRLVSRYIPREQFMRLIPPHTDTLTLTELYKQVSPPDFKRPINASPNFVVFGIVATRSVTRESSRGTKFVTIVLSDLTYDISLALHGKAHEKFWKVRPGTLLALFNPQFYIQKYENTARTLALSVSKETCLVELGQAKDLGQCESLTSTSKNSKRCKNWVDVRKSHVCDFHVEQKAIRTKRPELNASSAKLWDPKNSTTSSARASRMTVYKGGEVPWKRGLQIDTQAGYGQSNGNKGFPNFKGFPDAPVGRVFQRNALATNRNDPSKYEESLENKRRKQLREIKKLELVTDDAKLKSQLLRSPSSLTQPKVTKTSSVGSSKVANQDKVFARTQLRKLGFHPLSLSSSVTSKPPMEPQRERSIPVNNDSDSDDLEII